MAVPLSILDLAYIGKGQTARDSFAASVALAQRADVWGYRRIWYAEHHNMPSIASSATSVLIAHVAAHTQKIRLGAGGVMLPNHAPLTIAEQFGTLETCTRAASIWVLAERPAAIRTPCGHCAVIRCRRAASRRTCRSCRDISPASLGSPEWTRPRGRARMCRCTSSAPHCSGPGSLRRSGSRTASLPTSHLI